MMNSNGIAPDYLAEDLINPEGIGNFAANAMLAVRDRTTV
jgi:hypothetical protein